MSKQDESTSTRWTLIGRLKDWQDNASWEEFCRIYSKFVYGIAQKSGLTHAESEEVVQETLTSVAAKMNEFKAIAKAGSFKAWLSHLTHWRIKDQFRKRDRAIELRAHSRRRNYSDETPSTSTVAQIPDPEPTILEKACDEEWETQLRDAALERVKRQVAAEHYQVFHLNVIRGLAPALVARAQGVSTGQVYLIRHRVGRLLKKAADDLRNRLR